MVETTISVIKADIGSLAGHVVVPDFLFELARKEMKEAVNKKIINDFYVANAGDDLELIMTHNKGEGAEDVHKLAWDTFMKGTELAREKKIYAAGQDMLADTFSGNVKGLGPGSAEMVFEERKSEPVAIFMADKTEPGAFNLPVYKIYADPFNTAGLVIDPNLHDGFNFIIQDIMKDIPCFIDMKTPEESYDVLALLGSTGRYTIKKVYRHDGMVTASVSTDKLHAVAGKYVGKDDPVAIIRAHNRCGRKRCERSFHLRYALGCHEQCKSGTSMAHSSDSQEYCCAGQPNRYRSHCHHPREKCSSGHH